MAGKTLESLNLDHIVKNTINDQLLNRLGQLAVDMIRTRTRLGYGVGEFGAGQEKLKQLAPATVVKRQNQPLSRDTSPKKSNLTATGQLLDSIQFRVAGNKVEVFIPNGRNETIATYVSEERPFFTLSKTEVSRLANLIEEAIQNYLSKGS